MDQETDTLEAAGWPANKTAVGVAGAPGLRVWGPFGGGVWALDLAGRPL